MIPASDNNVPKFIASVAKEYDTNAETGTETEDGLTHPETSSTQVTKLDSDTVIKRLKQEILRRSVST